VESGNGAGGRRQGSGDTFRAGAGGGGAIWRTRTLPAITRVRVRGQAVSWQAFFWATGAWWQAFSLMRKGKEKRSLK